MQNSVRQTNEAMGLVYGLIGLCVLAFFVQMGQDPETGVVENMFALDRASITERFELWRLVTYSFLHGSFTHILFNMWGLYLFGSMIAHVMTPTRMAILYLVSAILGGLIQISVSPVGCIGASGAVCGFTAAAVMVLPQAKIMIIFAPIPMSMKTFFWIFIGLEVFLNGVANDNIAHMAHIGGLFGGYLYIRLLGVGMWDPFGALIGRGQIRRQSNEYRDIDNHSAAPSPTGSGDLSPQEIDRLLDKISRHGVNSLSEREYELLKRAKDRLKGR